MSSLPRECAKLREHLPELAEGVLGGSDRARLEGHLASCPRCAAELADLRAVVSALRTIPPDPLPAHILGSVRRAVAGRARPIARTPVQHWARLVLASSAAAVVLAMALAFHFTQGGVKAVQPMLAKKADQFGAALQRKSPAAGPSVEVAQAPVGAVAVPALPSSKSEGHGLARAPGPQARDRLATGGGAPITETPPQPVMDAALAYGDGVPEPAGGGAGRGGAGGGAFCRRSPDANQSKARRSGGESAGAARRDLRLGAILPEATAREAAKAAPAQPSPPPARARLGMINSTRQLTITLAPGAAAEDASLVMRQPDGHPLVLWQGRLTEAVTVPIPAGALGGGPASIPITIESQLGRRQYVLFLPVLSRLGQTAPSLPAMRYDGDPLGNVFAQLSALSGLALLVEAPLDQPVYGELPAGEPSAALARLAGDAGFQVDSEGEIVRTLTRAKGG